MSESRVAVLNTRPETVLEDYRRLLGLAEYTRFIPREQETLLKLNLSWTKYFPACSSEPWQVEGLVRTLLEDGYSPERLFPVENKTVVTDPVKKLLTSAPPALNEFRHLRVFNRARKYMVAKAR